MKVINNKQIGYCFYINAIMKGAENINKIANATAQVTGDLLNPLFSQGMSSKAGSTFTKLGKATSSIPLVGGYLSSGLNITGGAINGLFGKKINEQNLNTAKGLISDMNNTIASSNTWDGLNAAMSDTSGLQQFSKGFYGKDGLFTNQIGHLKSKYNQKLQDAFTRQNNTFALNADNIMNDQMSAFNRNYYASGGNLDSHGAQFDNGLTFINAGGSHEQNPYEGVPFGVDAQGTPNAVEEGEVVYDNDYVFSDRLYVPQSAKRSLGLNPRLDYTFAQAAKVISKESQERPNDPISQRGLDVNINKLRELQQSVKAWKEQEEAVQRQQMQQIIDGQVQQAPFEQMQALYGMSGMQANPYKEEMPQDVNTFDWGGFTSIDPWDNDSTNPAFNDWEDSNKPAAFVDTNPSIQTPYYIDPNPKINILDTLDTKSRAGLKDLAKNNKKGFFDDFMNSPNWRYAPLTANFGSAISDAFGLTNKPDYTAGDDLLRQSRSSALTPIRYSSVGSHQHTPAMDINFGINTINADQAATRRALLQSAGLNRNAAEAALLSAGQTSQYNLGDQYIKSNQYNTTNRNADIAANNALDAQNAQSGYNADAAYQNARLTQRQQNLALAEKGHELRAAAKALSDTNQNANLTNLFNSVSNLGKENFSRNMIISNPANYYYIDREGTIRYKVNPNSLSEAERKYIELDGISKGGKIG